MQSHPKRNSVTVDTRQNSIDLMVGTRIRMRRLALGLTEEDLARALGVPVNLLRGFETGSDRVGAPRLLQLSQMLTVPVGWFFEGIGQEGDVLIGGGLPTPGAVAAAAKETSSREQLLSSFDRIASERSRGLLVRLANHLADLEAGAGTEETAQ